MSGIHIQAGSGSIFWANVAPSFSSNAAVSSFWNPSSHRWEPYKKERELLDKIVSDWKAKPNNPVDKWNTYFAVSG